MTKRNEEVVASDRQDDSKIQHLHLGGVQMIIASGKNSGKRLVRKIEEEIREKGYAEVAALSMLGILKIQKAGQNLANATGRRISATPEEREVDLGGGEHRLGLVVRIEFEKGVGA